MVWESNAKKQVSVTLDGKEEIYQADHIILATGARSGSFAAARRKKSHWLSRSHDFTKTT